MAIKRVNHPKDLFSSLAVGDLLMIPGERRETGEMLPALSVVLRFGDGGTIYLSWPTEERPDTQPDPRNPYCWSDDQDALIDCDGEVPPWYSVDIQCEHRGALKEVDSYNAVPRLKHLQHPLGDSELRHFRDHDTRFPILHGITANGEAGPPMHQLELALSVMGVAVDKEQMIGLSCFMKQLMAQSRARTALLGFGTCASAQAEMREVMRPHQK